MEDLQADIQLIHMLLARLERISADSFWAHRASGARGALLKVAEKMEKGQFIDETEWKGLLDKGFQVLENAAQEKTK
jgi:hypothetical protein